MPELSPHKIVLTIAGFDGSGGAGIQADLKTFAALGCYGLSVLTALPVQNTCGVRKVYPIGWQCVEEQLKALLEDFDVGAVKIGMLNDKEVVACVAKALRSYKGPIVCDPVITSTSGHFLMQGATLDTMRKMLFPLVTILTPNLEEASAIVEKKIHTKKEMEVAAKALSLLGPQAILVKGGHLAHNTCDDYLFLTTSKTSRWFSSKRIFTKNTHGTGCTLSAALAAFLVQGFDIITSTAAAKRYLSQAIASAAPLRLGCGCGPVHHFFTFF